MSIFASLNKIKLFLSINLLYILLSKSGRILHTQPSKLCGKLKYLESKKKKSHCYEILIFSMKENLHIIIVAEESFVTKLILPLT